MSESNSANIQGDTSFGELLRRMRHKQVVTQGDLAISAKTTQSVIAALESNTARPTLDQAHGLAEALQVPKADYDALVAAAQPPLRPRVLVSYQRSDPAFLVNRILQELTRTLPAVDFEVDIGYTDVGSDWERKVGLAAQTAQVILLLMGPNWDITNEAIRAEVKAIGGRTELILPVLIDRADIPDVPRELLNLSDFAFSNVNTKSLDADLLRLARTVDYRIKRAGEPALSGSTVAAPRLTSRFIDRVAELARLEEATLAERPVLICGPGGIGKTQLALVFGDRVAEPLGLRVVYVSLDREGVDTLEGSLGKDLVQRQKTLLILDDVRLGQIPNLADHGDRGPLIVITRDPTLPLRNWVRIELGPLDIQSTAGLIASAVEDTGSAEGTVVETLARLTGGVPLAAELARSVVAREGLDAALAMIGDVDAPRHTVAEFSNRFLDTLDRVTLRLLALAALANPNELDTFSAASILKVDEDALLQILDRVSPVLVTGSDHALALHDILGADVLRRVTPNEREVLDLGLRSWRARRDARSEPKLTRDYWTTEDRLNFASYADAIVAFLRHPGTYPPLTIGISGAWGTGKTSLMRMIQARLDPVGDESAGGRQSVRLVSTTRNTSRRGKQWFSRDDKRTTNAEILRLSHRDLDSLSADEITSTGAGWRPTVWFNPWMYQSGEQLWAGLSHSIIDQITGRMTTADRERFWLKLNMARVDRSEVRRKFSRLLFEQLVPTLLIIVGTVLLAAFGILLAKFVPVFTMGLKTASAWVVGAGGLGAISVGAIRILKFMRRSATDAFQSLLAAPEGRPDWKEGSASRLRDVAAQVSSKPDYTAKLGFLYLVQTDMRKVLDLVATPERPVVIFVDDLDRCSPGAVAQVIEAVNLFLAGEFPNCIFVLAMEPAVVAAHVEVAYKDVVSSLTGGKASSEWSSLGWRFLEKIVQLPLNIPVPSSLADYMGSLFNQPDQPGKVENTSTIGEVRVSPGDAADVMTELVVAESTESPAQTLKSMIFDEGALASPEFDEGRVADLEAAIFKRRPDTDGLAAAARMAQREVLGSESAVLLPETLAAVDRVFAHLYSDVEALESVSDALPLLRSGNPRELKRYVNVFRFYTFIVQRQVLMGRLRADSGQIAKLCALAIRWPQHLGTLNGLISDRETHLMMLERLASSEVTAEEWEAALVEAVGAEFAAAGTQLRSFLTHGSPIGELSRALL